MKNMFKHPQKKEKTRDRFGPWDFVDKVYCISLDEREDRRATVKEQFRAVRLLDRVEFVIVPKNNINTEKGIYESHVACLKTGIQADARTIGVFEDDVCFERFRADDLKHVVAFSSAGPHWDILFLGCLVGKSERTTVRSVLKIKYSSLSHAYIMHRRFAETVVKTSWRGVPYDNMLRLMGGAYYSVYPSFAFQNDMPSDNNERPFLERFRTLFGGLRRIQKANERYHRHKLLIWVLQIFAVLFVMLLMVYFRPGL